MHLMLTSAPPAGQGKEFWHWSEVNPLIGVEREDGVGLSNPWPVRARQWETGARCMSYVN